MNKNIVLVTGMSGAGKTSAMNALEDMGYYSMDNFPKELLPNFEELLQKESRYDYVALSVSAIDFLDFMNYFQNISIQLQTIFLDCSDEQLLLRYRFTRRQHPMIAHNLATTLEEAIEVERDLFDRLENQGSYTLRLDTSKMSASSLTNVVRSRFPIHQNHEFTLTFQSFGFKHGLPLDADEVIDVRFLVNPFYEPELREKTGNDQDVYDYVIEDANTQQFLAKLKFYLDFVFENYRLQNKSHMIVSIGCTGGQHRSVSVCNWLYDQYKETYHCFKSHRDIGDSQ